jgi:hypothetical protein
MVAIDKEDQKNVINLQATRESVHFSVSCESQKSLYGTEQSIIPDRA